VSSLRKKYRVEDKDDLPPVTTPPSGQPRQATEAPTPEDITKPETEAPQSAEQAEAPKLTELSPGQEAGQSAMRSRLAEMERAASMQHEAVSRQPRQPSTEQIIAGSGLPERAKTWLRQHPEYINNMDKNAAIRALHDTATQQAGSEWTDAYFRKMEYLLGISPPQSNRDNPPTPRPAPVRQQYAGPPVSAMPSRDIPSMGTGRSQSYREPMTAAEREIARSTGISDEQYMKGKERMLRLKAAGVIQNG
jgi:hypothetical protein